MGNQLAYGLLPGHGHLTVADSRWAAPPPCTRRRMDPLWQIVARFDSAYSKGLVTLADG